MRKWGVEFVSPEHDRNELRRVRRGLGQVDALCPGRCAAPSSTRSCFATPRAKGARPTKAAAPGEVAFDDDGATSRSRPTTAARATWRARYPRRCLRPRHAARRTSSAASGRTRVTTARRSTPTIRGVERLPGKLEGNITIFWFAHGWFWLIPLADGTTSIGAVCWPYYLKSRTKPLPRVLRRHDRAVPAAGRAARAAPSGSREVHATGNYSYRQRAQQRRALPAARRCLCLHRSGVLVRRLPGDAERLRRRRRGRGDARPAARGCRGAAPLRPLRAPRPARVLLVHLPRHQPDDARVLHGTRAIRCASRRRCCRCWPATSTARRRSGRRSSPSRRCTTWSRSAISAEPGAPGGGAASTSATSRRRPREARCARGPVVACGALLAVAGGGRRVPMPGRAPPAPGSTAAPAGPLWELGIGAAAVRLPDYRGSDQAHSYLLPLPYVVYRGKILRADRDGARALLLETASRQGRRQRRRVGADAQPRQRRPQRHGRPRPGASRSARTSMSSCCSRPIGACASTCACRCARRSRCSARRASSARPSRRT